MLRRIALTLFALCLPGLALAQTWVPERPVRIILPFPPGGLPDELVEGAELGEDRRAL
jgi:tripartite-type tricarboxylate transporter receptor subunit TctC